MDKNKVTLEKIYHSFKSFNKGELASYIPELLNVGPDQFSLSFVSTTGDIFEIGDFKQEFTIQSISKPFLLASSLEHYGNKKVEELVGVEPTGEDFNDIVKLDRNQRVMNPMVNSGAIVLSGLFHDIDQSSTEKRLRDLFSSLAGRELSFNNDVFKSERETAYKNKAIAYLLKHFDILKGDLEETLDIYFKQCSLALNSSDLAFMAATMANAGVHPKTQKKIIGRSDLRNTLSVMLTCGMYNYSGHWTYDIGLPAKSGVSGGILMVVPNLGGIGIYSPKLDERGNSARGIEVCKALSKELGLHLF